MHQATLVITDNFPTFQMLNDQMFPYGYPDYSESGLALHMNRFDLEVHNLSEEVINRTLNQYSVSIQPTGTGTVDHSTNQKLRFKYEMLWRGRGGELTEPVILEEIVDGKTYLITISKIYKGSLLDALKLDDGIDTGAEYYKYARELPDDATENDIYTYMLSHGHSDIIHIVDNKPQLYTLHGFECKWDWWVIGGRWSSFIKCNINGDVNATACYSLNLDALKEGGIAYARDILSTLFNITTGDWDHLHRYGDLGKIERTFAMAVLEYLYIKKSIVEFNGEDPLDYANDYKDVLIDKHLPKLRMEACQEYVLETARLKKRQPGELTIADIDGRLILPDTTALAELVRELRVGIRFTDSFFCSDKITLDHTLILKYTSYLADYIKNMDMSVLGRIALLADGIWYDSWDHSHYLPGDEQKNLYLLVEEMADIHQALFESLDKNSLYYTSMVELPEGRAIPWHMFIEFMLSHERYKDKFVTVLDSHI